MTVDEAPGELGRTLFLPPHEADRAEDLRAMLPQFALPGQERFPVRHLPFVHRFNRPKEPDGTTLVLLHGSGGNEADLMPIARRIAPRSALLGVRGRATEEGTYRWFRRLDATTFDQADIRSEAEAFSAFVEGAVTGYGLDPDRLVFLGYSNGANFWRRCSSSIPVSCAGQCCCAASGTGEPAGCGPLGHQRAGA
jgi:phospholipase/carboxylesterase